MADRDDESRAGEDVGLAERHVLALELRGPQHQEQGIAEQLEVGPLMGVQRVLDRQRMQLELGLDLPQLGLRPAVKAHPHEVAGLLRPTAPLLDRDVGDALSTAVGRRRDQLADCLLSWLASAMSLLGYGAASIAETDETVRAYRMASGSICSEAGVPTAQPESHSTFLI